MLYTIPSSVFVLDLCLYFHYKKKEKSITCCYCFVCFVLESLFFAWLLFLLACSHMRMTLLGLFEFFVVVQRISVLLQCFVQ